MKNMTWATLIILIFVTGPLSNVSANSVGFDSAIDYDGNNGTISVTVEYDFTDFAMFGGGLDVFYDPDAVVFVSFTQAELPADAQAAASPVGALTEPGLYEGFGIGTFEFFNGMTSAGNIGVFVFQLIGPSDGLNTPCGFTICLAANPINPFVSLAGQEVSADLLADGITGIGLPATHVPVPAALWMMLGALGAIAGCQRRA